MGRTLELLRRARAPVVALALAAALVGDASSSSHDLRHRADDARSRAAEARQQEVALAHDVDVQSARIDGLEAEIGVLGGELAALERRLGRSRARLRALETRFREKTRTLRRAGREVTVAQQLLSRRLVEIYTSDEPGAFDVVLGARSIDELIDLLEVQTRVVESDAELVERIEELRRRVTRERARTRRLREQQAVETGRIERRTNEQRAAVASLVARRDSLADLRSARRRSLAAVQVERRGWEAQADALEAESQQVASLVGTAPAAPAAGSSAGYVWPVRGSIVSPYGQRWGRLHAGIDIAAPAGTPIVAAASGQVVYAGSMSGYGLIVVIQHAGGIATAYAHNSSIGVGVGQTVAQGETIAAVGCTGHCYGDHVHFEVRVGGSPVDPMGYL